MHTYMYMYMMYMHLRVRVYICKLQINVLLLCTLIQIRGRQSHQPLATADMLHIGVNAVRMKRYVIAREWLEKTLNQSDVTHQQRMQSVLHIAMIREKVRVIRNLFFLLSLC